MFGLKKVLVVCLVVGTAMLIGCAGSGNVKTYSGDELPDQETAVLQIPESINLLSVNGRRMTRYLVEDVAVNYALKPGENELVLEYATLWALSKKSQDGAKAQTVRSDRKTIVIVAKPGETYSLKVTDAENIAQAQNIASQFEPELIASSGATVQTLAQRTLPENARLDQPAYASNPNAGSSSVDTEGQLKAYWQKATAEEKQRFLKWALQ